MGGTGSLMVVFCAFLTSSLLSEQYSAFALIVSGTFAQRWLSSSWFWTSSDPSVGHAWSMKSSSLMMISPWLQEISESAWGIGDAEVWRCWWQGYGFVSRLFVSSFAKMIPTQTKLRCHVGDTYKLSLPVEKFEQPHWENSTRIQSSFNFSKITPT